MGFGKGAKALLAATALAAIGAGKVQAAPGTILWDQYGVPHIYGPDIPTVVRGLGYAQMENHAETLLNNVAHARGRSAEFLGVGTNNFNLNYDIRVRTYGIPQRAAAWVSQGGSFQLSVLQAFCAGVNEYAQKHPGDILPQLKPILPVVPSDITAGELDTIWYTFLPEQDGDPSLIAAWQSGGMGAANKVRSAARIEGSNGWAIAPSNSADQHALLMGNPHLPWGVNQPISNSDVDQNFGVYQWVEANLVIGNSAAPTLNAQGVTFVGGPFIGIGFSDHVGWTHTNDTIQNADVYQLTLDSTGTKYLFGGNYLPLQHTQSTIKVLQPDGTTASQVIDIYNSIHGPLVAFNANRTQALALRVAGLGQPSLVTQYWDMIQAKNLKQFKAAESMLQMPFFNTMFADNSGEIYYLFGGQQPKRVDGTPWQAVFNKILDGTDPSTLWTQTLPFSGLPQVANPSNGWVANSNNPPWTTALPTPPQLQPSAYPTYIAPNFMDFRPQHGALYLMDAGKLSPADVLTGKMSTYMVLAERVLPDLLKFANAAAKAGDTTAAAAAAVLSQWTYLADSTSVGAVLFEEWWDEVVANLSGSNPTLVADDTNSFYSPHPKFKVGWSFSKPTSTPSGLDPVNSAELVTILDNAYNTVSTEFASQGGASVPWGGAHKTTLVTRTGADQALVLPFVTNDPLSGADDPFGPLRVVNPTYIGALNEFISYGGDGYVQVIDFGRNGSTGGTLLTYGNASRPYSPHIADQEPLFQTKSLKPALRTLSDVQQNAVSTETY